MGKAFDLGLHHDIAAELVADAGQLRGAQA